MQVLAAVGWPARMHVRRLATCVEVQTPAKLNLFLEVLGKRSDGYHEIETLIVGLEIYDTLVFTPIEGEHVRLNCRWAMGAIASQRRASISNNSIYEEIPAGPKNLVWRAIELLRSEAGITAGATVELVKRIPAAAGLGGGSSDAAAALVAANVGWRLEWPRERLAALAAKIGSDVPFFLTDGAAICRGRGERIEPIAARRLQTVVVRPPAGISTADVYQACQVATQRAAIDPLRNSLAAGNSKKIGSQMVNRLEAATAGLTPFITQIKTRLIGESMLGQQMSGSGTSYFGICRSARNARRVASRLRARRSGAVFAATTAAAR